MFHINIWEILLIILVALIVFGPKQLPEIAENIGKLLGKFRRSISNIKQDIDKRD